MRQHGEPTAPPSQTAARPLPRLHTFDSLKYRDFRFLWFTTLFSSGGNWIQQVTLGWLVYELTGSAVLVATLVGVRQLPTLVVGPISGVLVDRLDRRKLLLGTSLFLGVLSLGFGLLVASDAVQVWHLFVLSLLTGMALAMDHPLRQALVANSVPREGLLNAIALNSTAFNATRTIGPAVAGLLIAFAGADKTFFLQAACYGGVFLMVLQLRVPQADASASRQASMLSNFNEGVRYALGQQTIMALILLSLVPALFMWPFVQGLMPVFSKEVLHVGPKGLGLLYSSNGLGAFFGTLVLASLSNTQSKGRLLLASATATAVAVILFSFTTRMPLALGALLVMGLLQQLYMATNNTLIQSNTPDAMRGRVLSLYMLDFGLMPFGGLLAGVLAESYGVPFAVLVGGVVNVVLVVLMGFWFRDLRRQT
jgi:MFS family permease